MSLEQIKHVEKVEKTQPMQEKIILNENDPEKMKLQSLADVVQKKIEGTESIELYQRQARGKLTITKKGSGYDLSSYKQATLIVKIGSDYKVLGELFDKPEEAIKYANFFNYLKYQVIENKGLSSIIPNSKGFRFVYGNNEDIQRGKVTYRGGYFMNENSMPDSKNDGSLTDKLIHMYLDDRYDRRLTKNLVNHIMKFVNDNEGLIAPQVRTN